MRDILGFNSTNSTGLVFPYLKKGLLAQDCFKRVKPDEPPLIQGKKPKYLTPKNGANHLYVPPGVEEALGDVSKPLYITEGEKKALKAVQESLCCVALAGVWSWKTRDQDGESEPLPEFDEIQWKWRSVYVVFDSDALQNTSVKKAELELSKELSRRGAVVRAIRLPVGSDQKIGLDDYLLSHTVLNLLQLPQENPLKAGKASNNTQQLRLIELASAVLLFHAQNMESFAFLDGIVVPLRSKAFRIWLARQMHLSEGKTPNSDSMNQALDILEGKARFEGPAINLCNRVGLLDGSIWYDLGTDKAVKIFECGWEIVPAPVLFRRYNHQQTQVTPSRNSNITRLFDFVSVPPEHQVLLLAYLVSLYVPEIPHPIFHPHGPQGSGKTTLFKVFKRLVDPSSAEVLISPRDPNQLVQVFSHHYLCLIDNLSDLPGWMSDLLCQACTGGGFSKRQLYTDDEDIIYQVKRPIGINGINQLATQADLMDRSILLHLDGIPSDRRRDEDTFWREFEAAMPAILGGILDTLAKAMSIYPQVKLSRLPRMADFARWGYAIAEALEISGEAFLKSYNLNIEQQNEEVVQGNTLAQVVFQLLSTTEKWEGSVKEAWERLFELAQPKQSDPTFPKSERTLRKHLERIKPVLEQKGVVYQIGPRGAKGYPITFQIVQKFDAFASTNSKFAIQQDFQREVDLNLGKAEPF